MVGICARGYAPQKIPLFEDQRATYVRGDASFIAQRSGRLTKLFCSQKICRNEKRQRSAAQIFEGGTDLRRNNASVFSSRLSDSAHHLSSLLLPTSMAMTYFNALYAEHFVYYVICFCFHCAFGLPCAVPNLWGASPPWR